MKKWKVPKTLFLSMLVALFVCLVTIGFLIAKLAKPTYAAEPEVEQARILYPACLPPIEIYDPEPAVQEPIISDPIKPEPVYRNPINEELIISEPDWIEYRVTAYCPCEKCCGKWSYLDHGGTASGARAKEGVTIAMGESYPFGTRIYIDGIGERIVQDRGGAITDSCIDLYFDTHEEVLGFGMHYLKARVIK